MNAPVNPVANFERDGHMNINGNQGSRPNYLSTLDKIKLPPRAYVDETHQQWTVSAHLSGSNIARSTYVRVRTGRRSCLTFRGDGDRLRLASYLLERPLRAGPAEPHQVGTPTAAYRTSLD